jgi:hypothetical protein
MRGGHAKQVVYRYNGHQSSDEIEFDAHGDLSFVKGDIIRRPGKELESRIYSLGRSKGSQATAVVVSMFGRSSISDATTMTDRFALKRVVPRAESAL